MDLGLFEQFCFMFTYYKLLMRLYNLHGPLTLDKKLACLILLLQLKLLFTLLCVWQFRGIPHVVGNPVKGDTVGHTMSS